MKIWIAHNALLSICYFGIAIKTMFFDHTITENTLDLIGVVFLYHGILYLGKCFLFFNKSLRRK